MNPYQPMDLGQVDPVSKLATFLRKHGTEIEDKSNKFSLSSSSLVYLNKCFSHIKHQAADTPSIKSKKEQDAAYLLKFFQRMHAVKLVHGTLTVQGAVDIGPFRALTFLEIKRVPVHLLVGICALRRQLEVLVCSRSLASISTLLQSCGGDMCSGAPWPSLHTVNLSHNHIDKLDDSLKLLPSVKVLDLSHNNIKHTRNYLEDLSEIAHLNLGFNQMETMPALGLVARTNLKSLSLKNNNLESLAGLEDYTSLEVLDVATNCIFDRLELRMLGYLHNIKAVYLQGNPIYYDQDYRIQLVKRLPHQTKRFKTKVDGKPLTISEAELVSPEHFTPSPHARRPPSRDIANDFENSLNADISSFEDSMDLSATRPLIKKSRGKRNLRKVKHAAIADPAKAHLESNTSITTTSDSDIEGTKQKYEQMRKNHGSDWLLALQDPYLTPSMKSATVSKPASTNKLERPTIEVEVEHHFTERTPADREIIAVEKLPEESNPPDVNDTADTGYSTQIHSRTDQPSQIDTRTNHNESDQNHINDDAKIPIVHEDAEQKLNIKEMDSSINVQESDMTVEDSNASQYHSVKETDSGINIYQTNEHGVKETDSVSNIYQVKSSESVEGINGNHQGDTSNDEAQELLSPLLVTVYSKNDMNQVQLFVTVKSTHIEERDIHGQVAEELDLVSLKGMKKTEDTLRDSDSQFLIMPVVELTFDYIRRDRQKRRYFMENEESCLALFNVLEPFVERSQAEARRKGMVQCLKCSTEFYKGEAKRKVHKRQRKSLVTSGVEAQDASGSDIDSMNEILVCPECNSGLIVDLECPQLGDGLSSNVSTPMGSVSSLEISAKPIATSSPWKPLDDTKSSPSTDYHSAEGSPPSSPHRPSFQTAKSETSTVTPDTRMSTSTGSTLANSAINSAESSLAKKSLLGDFKLPDSTLRMSMGENPGAEISPYPPEKLSQVLYTGVKGFDQKYSLVPQDILSGNSSAEVSRSSSPRSKEHDGRTVSLDGSVDNQQTNGTESKDLLMARKSQSSVHSGSIRQSSDRLNVRNRKPSGTGSEDDIEILDKHSTHQLNASVDENLKHLLKSRTDVAASNRLGSNDSDIAVLGDDPKVDSATTEVFEAGNDPQSIASALSDAASRMQPLSPVAELTNNVSCLETSSGSDNDIHIHADYPATQTLTKEGGIHLKNGDSLLEHSSTESQMHDSIYSQSKRRGSSPVENVTVDFSQVDHRLKLYFDMELFGDDEEFRCMIKANIYQLSKSAEFKGYLLISTNNLYIMKITKEESDTLSDWLSKRTQHPIRDLLNIHVGLGNQSFQLEFNNDGILYTIAIRDKNWCDKFVSQLTDVVHASPINKRKYKGIIRDHPNTLANLLCQVFGALLSENSSPEVDTDLTVYTLAYRKIIKEHKKKHSKESKDSGVSLQLEPVGLAVTAEDVYLIEENHYWPLQQSKSGRSRGQGSYQFKHLDQHAITDITRLELYEDAQCDVTVNFHSEDSGEESQWHIQSETLSSLGAFISAIQEPWQHLFGVAMPQIVHPTITILDEF